MIYIYIYIYIYREREIARNPIAACVFVSARARVHACTNMLTISIAHEDATCEYATSTRVKAVVRLMNEFIQFVQVYIHFLFFGT